MTNNPENFSETVSLKDFKVRKKSLLRKKLQEMRKKMSDQLPVISEAGELRVEELSTKQEN